MSLEFRHIPLQGTPNFRDIGGYPSRCGRKIKFNKIFRSGTLAYLSDDDWKKIEALNIRTICDFRREAERNNEPTKPPASLAISQVALPINPGNHDSFMQQINHAQREANAQRDADKNENGQSGLGRFMREINRNMAIEWTETFSSFLRQIIQLSGDDALLFHCAAGKDRTGFGAALILRCLNIEDDIIEQDYMLSGRFFLPDVEMENLIRRRTLSLRDNHGYDTALLKPVLEVRLEYIRSAFEAIDNHWGNFDNYLSEALKINNDELEVLRQQLLV